MLSNQQELLFRAVKEGDLNKVKDLVENGKANVDEKNKDGWTPLHIAAEKGHIDIVKYLIADGAEINVKNENGVISLHIAAEKDHIDILEFLIENGANINEENKDGWTPLHIAAEKGHIDIVKYLIGRGANVNAKNENGVIVLDYFSHYHEMQRFLFKHGAIPKKELLAVAQDGQSVHNNIAVERIKFTTKTLVKRIKADKNELKQAAEDYLKLIKEIAKRYKSNSLRLKLLALTKEEKKDVTKEVLESVPGDDEFIRIISEEAKKALEEKYLRKNANGEYDDYTKDNAKVTIPEIIGYAKLLIDKIAIPTQEKKELLATSAEQNLKSVEEKLPKIREELKDNNIFKEQIINRKELDQLLKNVDESKIGRLFEEIVGFNIEEIWKEQKYITLMKQIYVAATTYTKRGDEGLRSACGQGVWTQIISGVQEIDPSLGDEYEKYRKNQEDQEKLKNVITEGNVEELASKIADELIEYVTVNFRVKKIADELIEHVKVNTEVERVADELSEHIKNNLEVKKIADELIEYIKINNGLLDLAIATIDIDKPEEVTSEQIEVLKKINQGFINHIKEVLPRYNRVLPTREEYKVIIEKFSEVPSMQKFTALFSDTLPKLKLLNAALFVTIEKPPKVMSVQEFVHPFSNCVKNQ